jgi:cytochrome c peroxidase
MSNEGSGRAIVGTPHGIQPSKPANEYDPNELLKKTFRRPATIPFPASNPYTFTKAILGNKLFHDPRLSRSSSLSCASCHNSDFAWGDGRAKAVGEGMRELSRRSPTIINAAWGQIFMWDGRAPSLEAQVLGPMQSAEEMNMPLPALVNRLESIKGYRDSFQAAFPGQGINPENVGKALATYVRTIVSRRTPFDAWIDGRNDAISDAAIRGFAIFNTKGQCAKCHSGWNFTDDSFHDIGLPSNDIGRGRYLPSVAKLQYAFKTPGLREITRRGPFMHDGSLATLEAVVDHYDQGGVDRPSKATEVRALALTAPEKADLIAFLKTLTSEPETTQLPVPTK